MRTRRVLPAVLVVVTVGCSDAIPPPPSPTFSDAAFEPALPDPPEPLTLGSGSPSERAELLASATTPGSDQALAGWLAAYDTLGIPVFGEGGQALGSTGNDVMGIPFSRVWYASSLASKHGGIPLVDFVKLFATEQEGFDTEAAAAALLQDIRAAASSPDPRLALLGQFVADKVQAGPSAADPLEQGITPGDVTFDGPTAELMAWVILRDLVFAGEAQSRASLAFGAPRVGSATLASARRVPLGQVPFSAAPAKCTDVIGGSDEATAWILRWASSLTGGLPIPQTQRDVPGLIQLLFDIDTGWKDYATGAARSAAERRGHVQDAVGLVAGALTLLMLLSAMTIDVIQDPDPLVRTRSSLEDGHRTDVVWRLTIDPGKLPDGNGAVACAVRALAFVGIDFNFPESGRVEGAELMVEGLRGFGSTVTFEDYRDLTVDTNQNGEAVTPVIGIRQPRAVPDDASPVDKEFSIAVEAQPEAVTLGSLFDIFFAGLNVRRIELFGAVIPILKTVHWDMGEYVFRLRDWRSGWVIEAITEQTAANGSRHLMATLSAHVESSDGSDILTGEGTLQASDDGEGCVYNGTTEVSVYAREQGDTLFITAAPVSGHELGCTPAGFAYYSVFPLEGSTSTFSAYEWALEVPAWVGMSTIDCMRFMGGSGPVADVEQCVWVVTVMRDG